MCFRKAHHPEIKSWKHDSPAAVDDMTPVLLPENCSGVLGFRMGMGRAGPVATDSMWHLVPMTKT